MIPVTYTTYDTINKVLGNNQVMLISEFLPTNKGLHYLKIMVQFIQWLIQVTFSPSYKLCIRLHKSIVPKT